MRTLVVFEVISVSILVRGQKLAPKIPIGSFGSGQVHREAQRIAMAFECTIKVVIDSRCPNPDHIQIMKFVH